MRDSMPKSDEIPLRKDDEIWCDLCRRKIRLWRGRTWNPFDCAIKCVVRVKELVWTEYYHRSCLLKANILRKQKKQKAGRWDTDEEDPDTSNLVH